MAVIIIGMADMNVCKAPDILTTLGLGSCVGITLYDKTKKIGGMVHVMLPEFGPNMGQNRAKFADTGIADLLHQLTGMGVAKAALVAKMAGGAHMFSGSNNNILKIGDRNIASSLDTLKKLGIPLIANETGGQHGRTIELNTETGQLKIKTIGYGEKFV